MFVFNFDPAIDEPIKWGVYFVGIIRAEQTQKIAYLGIKYNFRIE